MSSDSEREDVYAFLLRLSRVRCGNSPSSLFRSLQQKLRVVYMGRYEILKPNSLIFSKVWILFLQDPLSSTYKSKFNM